MGIDKKTKKRFNIIAIICIVVFCITISPKTLQNDTFYTIKIGEHITETKAIDMEDQFSWHKDLKYTYPHWLYDTGIYLIYNAGENIATNIGINAETGGMTAIYISTMILASILGILIYKTNVKINKNHIVSFFLSLGVIYLLRNFIAARAQLVSYILFTLEILFIEQFLNTKKKRYAIGLFIIATLIANCHAAVWYLFFILALPYIGEALLIKLMESNLSYRTKRIMTNFKIKRLEKTLKNIQGENKRNKVNDKIEKLKSQKEELDEKIIKSSVAIKKMEEKSLRIKIVRRSNIKWLILVLAICLFSGLLTPQTSFEPYTHMIKLLSGNTTASISEHLPIVLIDSMDALIVLTIILTLLIFTDTKVTFKDLFMLGGLTILMLMSRRQVSMLVLIGVYSLNRIIIDFINKYDKEGIENKIIRELVKPYATLVISLVLILCGITFYRPKIDDKYVNDALYPVQASEFILNNLNVDDIRLYNNYNFGSYLLYKDIPVFIDSRCDLYSPEFNEKDIFYDALNIASLGVYYEDKFEEYGITHIITNADSKLKMLLEKDNNYTDIYQDDYFWIFQRNILVEK